MARTSHRLDETAPFTGTVLPLWVKVEYQPIGLDPASGRWRRLPLPTETSSLTAVAPGGRMLAWRSQPGTRLPDGSIIRGKDGYHRIPVAELGPLPVPPEWRLPLHDEADNSGGDRLEISPTGAVARYYTDTTATQAVRRLQVLDLVLPDNRIHSYRFDPREHIPIPRGFSPDGATLLLQSYANPDDAPARTWLTFLDVASGQVSAQTDPARELHLLDERQTRLAPYSPDGRHLLLRDQWMRVTIYTPHTDTTRSIDLNVANVTDYDTPSKGLIPTVIGFDDPDTLILASRRGHTSLTLTLFDIPTGTRTLLTKLTGQYDALPQLATMPDGYWQTWLHDHPSTTPRRRSTPTPAPVIDDDIDDADETDDTDADDPIHHEPSPPWALFVTAEHNPDTPLPGGSTVPDTWAAAIHHDYPPTSAVTVDPRTLMPTIDTYGFIAAPSTFLIHHPDHEGLRATFETVQPRLMLIDQYGDEHPDDPLDTYTTPNYVWATPTHPGQLLISIDTKGVPYPLLNRTILQLLTTALTDAGLTGAHLSPTD